MRFLILDYETRSEADLKKTGAYEYANHPTTQTLCASWRVGTKAELREQIISKRKWQQENPNASPNENPFAAKIWSPAFPNESDDIFGLVKEFLDPETILVAHNAFFEQVITRFVLTRLISTAGLSALAHAALKSLPHERWACTASMAAALALPRNLEGACLALNLPIQKDMDGRRLILKYCKPRKPTKNNKAKWHSSASDLRRIMLYCQNDVDAETMLFLSIPALNPTERKVWLLDQKINFRGFEADRELVKTTLNLIDEETKNLNQETGTMTFGELVSTTQRGGVLSWLEAEGVFLPDLRAKTVSDAIKTGLVDGDAKRMLEIRQAISKTSTAKYSAFEIRSRTDGRVRDNLLYHGASTGRWSGSGVQPQNFPRGSIADTTEAAEIVKSGDLSWVRCLYGNPMDVFSSCLRAVIKAPEGKELFCADYAAIEARVLFWVAEHKEGIRAYEENRPMYEEMAQVIYNVKDVKNVTKAQRQVGKQSVLGCGYGMGWKKFLQTCKSFGIEVDEDTAQIAVSAYRSTHWPVQKLWSNLDKAAIAATQNPGKKFRINKTTWWVENKFLWCELPSGRKLAYYGPEVKHELTAWGDKKPTLYHYGVNPLTRKWESSGTYGGRLAENVVQAISRDLMADAMLRIESSGYEIILSVHDELVAERKIGEGKIEEFEKLMAQVPEWAKGCPVRVEGWNGPRYKK